jgi:hypothetical protein
VARGAVAGEQLFASTTVILRLNWLLVGKQGSTSSGRKDQGWYESRKVEWVLSVS